jgi:hypothetical protein
LQGSWQASVYPSDYSKVTIGEELSMKPKSWNRSLSIPLSRFSLPTFFAILFGFASSSWGGESENLNDYKKNVQPILEEYCWRCHGGDAKKGDVSFDSKDLSTLMKDNELWLKTLRMLRSGMMPPKDKDKPSSKEIGQIENWVKYSAFGIDPKNPDPGRITLRRLNRIEYRNTIRDLMGVDFNTNEFPVDDSGHGFDNIGDVLTLSPLLLEKYIDAAKTIVNQVVPKQPKVPAEKRISGKQFEVADKQPLEKKEMGPPEDFLSLSYYRAATAKHSYQVEQDGQYQLVLDLSAQEIFVDGQFDYNKCKLTFKVDDKELLTQEFTRQIRRPYRFEFDQTWKTGKHELVVEVQPLSKERQARSLTLRIQGVTVRGPMAKECWVRPANYEKYFPGTVPDDPKERRAYSSKLIKQFASRAYRRPVDDESVEKLVQWVEARLGKSGESYESGIAQVMTIILASPRFLFREELPVPNSSDRFPLIDEYSLASRLSYFLWSSMPDKQLMDLADKNELRKNLSGEINRMLADKKASELTRNFLGQWLQVRDIDGINVNAFAVLAKDEAPDPESQKKRERFRALNRKSPETLTEAEKKEMDELRTSLFRGRRRFADYELNGELRGALRRETEMQFDHIVKNDRSLLELLDCDYTFLNEKLAKLYGIPNITGPQMRYVQLPPDSLRGGILTQGTYLIVSSNPDRTSPVKRGLFILDNLLGLPTPPPPPDVTPLEDAAATVKGKPPTLKEALKIHRADALCSSCHNRMDPLGLAFENFNAMGRYREKELGQPIESAGELITGEKFANVKELKRILATDRKLDFYRCISEKMLIYALGRGLEPMDSHTIDEIVQKLEASQGKPSVLVSAIIDSPAFQRRRPLNADLLNESKPNAKENKP